MFLSNLVHFTFLCSLFFSSFDKHESFIIIYEKGIRTCRHMITFNRYIVTSNLWIEFDSTIGYLSVTRACESYSFAFGHSRKADCPRKRGRKKKRQLAVHSSPDRHCLFLFIYLVRRFSFFFFFFFFDLFIWIFLISIKSNVEQLFLFKWAIKVSKMQVHVDRPI